jgi:hypothetical protein
VPFYLGGEVTCECKDQAVHHRSLGKVKGPALWTRAGVLPHFARRSPESAPCRPLVAINTTYARHIHRPIHTTRQRSRHVVTLHSGRHASDAALSHSSVAQAQTRPARTHSARKHQPTQCIHAPKRQPSALFRSQQPQKCCRRPAERYEYYGPADAHVSSDPRR